MLKSLNKEAKKVFCLACCERLFPVYQKFCERNDFGKYKKVRWILDQLWEELIAVNTIDAHETKNEVEELIPDTEDFEDPDASLAVFLGVALVNYLEFLETGKDKKLAMIPRSVLDAIDEQIGIQEDDGPRLDFDEEDEKNHPLMVREQSKQTEIAGMLLDYESPNTTIIQAVKAASSYDAVA